MSSPRPPGAMASSQTPSLDGREKEANIRYQVYSRLQSTSVSIGESFPIPEIVAIGGQSDGKSSLLEAFLGFRFNVREVEMGTRRPLIVQMCHDPSAPEPRCRLQNEDDEEYGQPIVPEATVAEALVRRTTEHLAKLGGALVSSKPIVMKVEFAHCPNLTIIDTPGFVLKSRNGEADRTPEEILSMVKAQAAPPHRLILFLQQSTMEWASSLWFNVVQEVDPGLQRTIFVASKFDNRMKEFHERWEVDKYLSASGYLPPTVRPFFVALPKERGTQTSAEWRKMIQDVDTSVMRHMREQVKEGFDEERFGKRIGFSHLKRFLEEELARRYREAAPHVLSVLQDRVEAASKELLKATADLRAAEDVSAMRGCAMRFASRVCDGVARLLLGCTDLDPTVHGLTSAEERDAARAHAGWPGVPGPPVVPPNAGLKLFGGAAFERTLNEFQEAAHALRFPSALAADRVANLLLAYKGRGGASANGRAAEDIARATARDVLGPLLDAACARLAFVLRRVMDAATDRALASGGTRDTLRPYVAFHAALRSALQSQLSALEASARGLLRQHLDASTSEFAMNLMASLPDAPDHPLHGARASGRTGGGAAGAGNGSGGVAADDQGADGEGDGDAYDEDSGVAQPQHRPIPETPPLSPMMGAAGAAPQPAVAPGPGRLIDNSPSRRAPKSGRHGHDGFPAPSARPPRAGGLLGGGGDLAHSGYGGYGDAGYDGGYDDVVRRAERLFNKIRFAVAQQTAPTTLKAAFLDPLSERLALDVQVELFARSDAEFMVMFRAPGALEAMNRRLESLNRRVDALLKMKVEFQELARAL